MNKVQDISTATSGFFHSMNNMNPSGNIDAAMRDLDKLLKAGVAIKKSIFFNLIRAREQVRLMKLNSFLLRLRLSSDKELKQTIRGARCNHDDINTLSIEDIVHGSMRRMAENLMDDHAHLLLEHARKCFLIKERITLNDLYDLNAFNWFRDCTLIDISLEISPAWNMVRFNQEKEAYALINAHFDELFINAIKYLGKNVDSGKGYINCNFIEYDKSFIIEVTNTVSDVAINARGWGKGLNGIKQDLEMLNEEGHATLNVVNGDDVHKVKLAYDRDLFEPFKARKIDIAALLAHK